MRLGRTTSSALVSLIIGAGLVGLPASPALAQVPPAPNPPIDDSCGIDVTLVLDASGSIESSGAVNQVRTAGEQFLEALADTNSTARVIDFGSVARQTAPTTLVTAGSLASGGVHRQAINAYYNPKPPFAGGATGRQYNSGDPQAQGSWGGAGTSNNQYTNWDQALDTSGQGQAPELVVFVTDGDPTAYDFNESGDPFQRSAGQAPNVGYRTDRNATIEGVTLDRAITEANQVKGNGSRMLAVGVGAALQNQASVNRLIQVSGPSVARTAADFDITQTDVALVADFDALAQALRNVVVQLCSPSLTITKLAQTAGNATPTPAPGWSFTVAPSVAGGTFEWILPDTAQAPSKTVVTDTNGVAQFQWEPDPATASSTATVTEVLQPGYTPETFVCQLRNADGTVDDASGPITGSPPTFTVPVGPEQIVTCTVTNGFNYAPAIEVTKGNAPIEVRGDLTPPARVTSSYAVTNPGNTPLGSIQVTDDQCAPVNAVTLPNGVNVGDANGDGKLDTTETWSYTCVREIRQTLVDTPINIVNTVTALGADPEGTVVTDTATDDVDVITPAIELTKLVGAVGLPPAQQITVTAGTEVTYEYTVTNGGNVALSPVVLVDDTSPCESPTFVGGDTNGDAALDLAETWTYTCVATASGPVINTATVTGTPLRPVGNPGPPVTSEDTAQVVTVDPELTLTKTVDQTLVFPGTPVEFTYVAENTGTADLRNPANPPGSPTIPPTTWIADNACSTPTYVEGDANNDGLLNAGTGGGAGEAWTFTCSSVITQTTLNTATIVAETVAPTPVTLTRNAVALVQVAEPAMSITKTALRGVVLDAAAAPDSGPDVPTPRPAPYLYEVTNTGSLPLAEVRDRLADDTCSPLTQTNLDTGGNDLLDVGETWRFVCVTQLSKSDGEPPDQPISSLVTNTATVTGTPVLNDVPNTAFDVSAEDIAQVLVIQPDITLTKTASPTLIRPGQSVTYTYTAANTGDVGLEPIAFSDDLCANVTNIAGDTNGNGLIDGANGGAPETWTATCTTALASPDFADVTNTATLRVIDPLGNTYERTAQATVQFFLADIGLTKIVSDEFVPTGSTVTYEFRVTNEGDDRIPAERLVLTDINLADESIPDTPTCNSPTFVDGDTNGDNALDVDEIWIYECSAVITEDTSNFAGVLGTDIQQGRVGDLATAFTGPFTPAIQVTKTAVPMSLLGGGPATYTYNVRNPGDVPLADVADRIEDDTCSPVTYVSGDTDGDGLLDTPNDVFEQAEDETWVFTCTTNITEDTVNTVVVEGTPTDPEGELLCPEVPCDVTDSAVASVTVVALGTITIVKQATPSGSTAFGFTGSLGGFSLVGDGSTASSRMATGLQPAVYAVTELVPTGWDLDGITCQDPSSDSQTSVSNETATINLGAGETVTCTFANSLTDTSGVATTGFGLLGPLRLGLLMLVAGIAMVLVAARIRREAGA